MLAHSISIKSVSCLVPGFEDGADYGELIPTSELLDNITNLRTQEIKVDNTFVATKMGIQSIAATKTSAGAGRRLWESRERPAAAARYAGQSNICLYRMLGEAVRRTLEPLGRASRIRSHIHIFSYGQPTLEYELVRIRRQLGIDHIDLHTLIIQQGCAGLFSALKTARTLLNSVDHIAGDVVLVTAENNMMPYLHQRAAERAEFTNIDSWLFPAIFGEGVGALAVGRTDDSPVQGWRIDELVVEMVERDWRVAPQWNESDGCSEVIARSRAVKQTYLTNVSQHAARGVVACGGAEKVFRLCLHESNPLLLRTVANGLNFPIERVPSISARVGTLAIASSFSLLARVTTDLQNAPSGQGRVVMVLIGEVGGGIRAGHLTLTL